MDSGSGSWVLNPDSWFLGLDSGFWARDLDSELWVLSAKFWIRDLEFWILILYSGFWILQCESWIWILDLVPGLGITHSKSWGILDSESCTPDFESWILDYEL